MKSISRLSPAEKSELEAKEKDYWGFVTKIKTEILNFKPIIACTLVGICSQLVNFERSKIDHNMFFDYVIIDEAS